MARKNSAAAKRNDYLKAIKRTARAEAIAAGEYDGRLSTRKVPDLKAQASKRACRGTHWDVA